MANKVRIKRRAAGGAVGAPTSLENAELAFNEQDKTLYYGEGTGGAGGSATVVIPIAGPGAFVDRTTAQTLDGVKTFNAGPLVPTAAPGTSTTQAASTAFVAAAVTGGSVADGDKGDVVVSGTGSIWTVDTNAITNAKLADVPTATFKGRTTALAGDPEDLTVAQAKALLNLANTNSGDQTITLTGNVTGTGTGTFATTIANDVVTNAKLANMAANTLKGNNTGVAADPVDMTVAQAKTLLVLDQVSNTSDANKPVSTAQQTALDLKINSSLIGAASGVAPLGADSKIASTYLPSYVDDVLEYANLAGFPATGATGIMYVALDTNKLYRWSGTVYVEISGSPGSTDAVPEGSVNLYYTQARADARADAKVAAHVGLADPHSQYALESALGTMSAQNASAVAITGGTIDGVVIDGGTF